MSSNRINPLGGGFTRQVGGGSGGGASSAGPSGGIYRPGLGGSLGQPKVKLNTKPMGDSPLGPRKPHQTESAYKPEGPDLDFLKNGKSYKDFTPRKGTHRDAMGMECINTPSGGWGMSPKVAGVIFGLIVVIAGITQCSKKVGSVENLVDQHNKKGIFAPIQKLQRFKKDH